MMMISRACHLRTRANGSGRIQSQQPVTSTIDFRLSSRHSLRVVHTLLESWWIMPFVLSSRLGDHPTPTQYCGSRTHPSWTKTLMRRCAASSTAMCGVTSQRTMKTLLIWCGGYNDTSTLPPVEGRASADFTTLVP